MLRPYQAAAIESALKALTKHGSAVMQMPTGAGKTKAATEIIKRHDKPVWFICHRQEIERQAAKAFAAAGIDFGVVSPRGRPEYDKPVQIVSVATLTRRIKDLPLPSLAIWDECHHVAAKSWAAIREQLNGAQNLGLTATPERLDGKGLSDWFGELVVGPSTRGLIDAGYLSDFRYFAPSDPDLASAKMQAGDYKKGDLDRAMNTPVLIGDAIAEYKKNAAGKRALVFCASVEASKALVERFNVEGIPAAHVDGTTPTEERDASVDALASGAIKVLSNVEVFTEGFDLPAIDVVILLRPTKSLALFLQMIGRALRTAEGKREALIFDHAGLWLDHDWFDLPIEWSLDGGALRRRMAGRTHGPRRCPECKEVRVEREMVCACGYEFPNGRELGEYDGVLRELRGVVPEGCVTQADFARRRDAYPADVQRWARQGMPMCGLVVPVADAEVWLSQKMSSVSLPKFAQSLGYSKSQGYRWRAKGMPVDERGNVEPDRGKKWVESHVKEKPTSTDLAVKTFARTIGVGAHSVRKWIRDGMPYNEQQKTIPLDSARAWVDENSSEEGVTIYSLAMATSISEKKLRKMVSIGLLTADSGGRLNACEAIATVNDINSSYELTREFAARLGIHPGTASKFVPRGIPHLQYGKWYLVHIQRGLEWVRDNTKIEIPPEAWPADNDNQPISEAA